ncbi:MAG: nicotinamide mononucleotide transporter [Bacteroidetes bacterium]|nr:nicotinamide mononucleotide transporter [Bacteroidota bacterium]
MDWQHLFRQFVTDIKSTHWQEWISTVTQVASVWYARKNNVLVYPTGIIGVLLASYVYFYVSAPPLYADATLNIYYFIMSVYGWYNWTKKKNDAFEYPISWCNKKDLSIGIGFFASSWLILFFVLKGFTNSNTPLLDSLVSGSAVAAFWWMAKRKVENWIAWIVSNIVAIPLNFYKGFMLFTLMYVLFLILAWMGYVSWKKEAVNTTKTV